MAGFPDNTANSEPAKVARDCVSSRIDLFGMAPTTVISLKAVQSQVSFRTRTIILEIRFVKIIISGNVKKIKFYLTRFILVHPGTFWANFPAAMLF